MSVDVTVLMLLDTVSEAPPTLRVAKLSDCDLLNVVREAEPA